MATRRVVRVQVHYDAAGQAIELEVNTLIATAEGYTLPQDYRVERSEFAAVVADRLDQLGAAITQRLDVREPLPPVIITVP